MPVAFTFTSITGKVRNSALSWFVPGPGRNRHAFARLGVAADLQRSAPLITMSYQNKLPLIVGAFWLLVVAFFALISLAGGEAFIGSFWWLFLLSLPISLLSALYHPTPYIHFIVVAALGLLQWLILGWAGSIIIKKRVGSTSR